MSVGETRSQLLDAAVEIFEERGYGAASVGAITERANTAHGTFYLYFKNKEDVFCQVMETMIVGELAAATAAAPPDVTIRQALEHLLRGFLSVYTPHSGLWRAVLEGALQSPRVQDRWVALRRTLIDPVVVGLEAQLELGTIRPLKDPVMTAHALASMTEWFAFAHFELGEPPGATDDIESAVNVLVDLWYHAVFGTVSGLE